MTFSPKLTDLQKLQLTHLAELVNFGGTRITSRPPSLKERPRKALILAMMVAIHNYTESIFILLSELRTNSAEALLRPLIESTINLSFIMIGRNERNAVRFILDDNFDRKIIAEKMMLFLLNNPKYKTSLDSMKTVDDWKKFINDREKEIAKIQKRYPYQLKQLPDLRARAKAYDDEIAPKRKRELKTRLEWWYLTMYWYFSGLTHLTTRGLGSFVSTDAMGNKSINLSGDPSSFERIVVTTYGIYFAFIRIYGLRYKIFTKDELKHFQKNYKMYSAV
jgi:hypothetical protein